MVNRSRGEGLMLACVVPKPNVEILTRAMHGLAKIGEELFVEPVESGLVFRTVHANYSVYAEALFKENFFAFYKNSVPADGPHNSQADDSKLNCRITMKSCLLAFRSLAWIKRQVETCLLTVEPTCLTVKFRCNHGLVRTHKLPVIECESLQAFYTEDDVPNSLSVGPKTFASVIKNFQSSERDITLAVDSEKAVLQNFAVGGADPKAIVRSQLKMEKAEFESFKVDEETAITFSLKAFRAVLSFADQAEYPLTIKFSSPGSPVIVTNSSPVYELRFVLSSLAPDECDVSRNHSQQMLTPLEAVGRNKRPAAVPRKASGEGSRQSDSSFNCSAENASVRASSRLADPGPSTSRSKAPSRSLRRLSSAGSQNSDSQKSDIRRDLSQRSVASTTGACVGTDRNSNRPAPKPVDKPAPSGLHWQLDQNPVVVPESDDEDDGRADEDVLPGTPPLPQPKKSRQFFQRCFEPTINCIDLPDDTVLAEDSD